MAKFLDKNVGFPRLEMRNLGVFKESYARSIRHLDCSLGQEKDVKTIKRLAKELKMVVIVQ